MLSLPEFEALLDHYLASEELPNPHQVALLKRWSEQLGYPEAAPLQEAELAEIHRLMWARIQALTASPDEPPTPS
jgi:DNA-directed RNA polymerase specialized sigma24 family protein